MVPLTWLLRKDKAGYEWGKKGFKLNHLLFTDDLKLNQIDSLMQTVHIFSENTGMQFGIKKCGVLIIERGKVIRTHGIRLPDGIPAVNNQAVSIMRYGAGILKWNTDELKGLDRRTRKFMTMHGALNPKSDIDRVYISREMGGRGLISCEGCIRMEENNLGWYVRNLVEPLIEGVKAAETIEYNDTVNKKEFKQRWMREKKELWKNKRIYEQFVREMSETT